MKYLLPWCKSSNPPSSSFLPSDPLIPLWILHDGTLHRRCAALPAPPDLLLWRPPRARAPPPQLALCRRPPRSPPPLLRPPAPSLRRRNPQQQLILRICSPNNGAVNLSANCSLSRSHAARNFRDNCP